MFVYATLGGMKGITWTQVAQYWVLITAFLIPADCHQHPADRTTCFLRWALGGVLTPEAGGAEGVYAPRPKLEPDPRPTWGSPGTPSTFVGRVGQDRTSCCTDASR